MLWSTTIVGKLHSAQNYRHLNIIRKENTFPRDSSDIINYESEGLAIYKCQQNKTTPTSEHD